MKQSTMGTLKVFRIDFAHSPATEEPRDFYADGFWPRTKKKRFLRKGGRSGFKERGVFVDANPISGADAFQVSDNALGPASVSA
ncbi:MAG: hypothetical protein DMG16_15185 [Acidobacteria bacterium]|nr:MAG: hypothetical protein DMG16_15185 [Acidobacteriota bacterium]